MPTTHRTLRSLLLLLVLLLGLMAAPAALAAQAEGDDDEDTTLGIIVTQDEDTNQDDADQHDADTDTNDADRDETDDDPPDCDDGGWAIVTTEDGTRFSSEDRCDDHVADHGEDSIVELGASQVDAYVDVYVAVPSGNKCMVVVTPVNGHVGEVVVVEFLVSNGDILRTSIAAGSDRWGYGYIPRDDFLQAGSAEVEIFSGDSPVGSIPIHMPSPICG